MTFIFEDRRPKLESLEEIRIFDLSVKFMILRSIVGFAAIEDTCEFLVAEILAWEDFMICFSGLEEKLDSWNCWT